MRNAVYFEAGTENKFAFVFSCPGKKERDADPQGPAKGQTGNNLNKLIEILAKDKRFSGLTREKVTITNSWDKVEFKALTGRTEANISEVLSQINLDRLTKEVEKIEEIIFACGKNAKSAILKLKKENKLNKNVKVFELRHLGFQSLNQIKEDINGKEIKCYKTAFEKPKGEKRSLDKIGKDNTQLRLEKVASDLLNDIKMGKEL